MEGEMVAQGKHEDLMKNCPEYVQIYNSQKRESFRCYEQKVETKKFYSELKMIIASMSFE